MPEGFDQLTLNWRSALTGAVMVCALLVAGFHLRRRIEARASLALAAFVALACLAAVPTFIGFAGAYDIWPDLTFLPTETFLLLGPLLVIHARALMAGPPTRAHLWLLAPGIVYWLYQLWAFTMLGGWEAKWAFTRTVHLPYVFPVITLTTWMMLAGCAAYVWILRRRYMAWLAQNHADNESFDPSWLLHLAVMAIIVTGYWIAKSAATIWFDLDYFESFLWDFLGLFLVFVISLEALAGLHQRFPKMGDDLDEPSPPAEAIPARDWNAEGARLQDQVVAKQWFLEPGLSLQVLSRRYGMNHVYLSRAINEGLGCNFNGFINRLRVDHAKSLLEKGEEGSLTEIALAAGFGSKASFNRAFKLHAGISPSDYRKRIMSR